jgi:pimeloyl-ACP methyl ester carboxylesterase
MDGHDVYAPTLTGLGERLHLASPAVNLSTHVQDVVNVMEYEDLRDVVLVGHSYGGMVIAGAADRVPERLRHLVYLDAFVPEDGQAMLDLMTPDRRPGMEARVRAEGEGWRLPSLRPVPWEQFVREDYGITDEAEVRWMVERLCPHPFGTMTEPVQLKNRAGMAVPRTYIRCTKGHSPQFDGYAEAARRPGSGWRCHELSTPHDAMITMPRELTRLLLDLA